MPEAPKKLTQSQLIGDRGVALVHQRVAGLGHAWHELRGQLDTGIDGLVEIRDATTGAMSGQVLLVQSRATLNPWPKDKGASFEWPCAKRDVEYWLRTNVPVLLIVSNPDLDEAYWVNIHDYFAGQDIPDRPLVIFDKRVNRFDESFDTAITRIAVRDVGVYLPSLPVNETLISNLSRINLRESQVCIAPAFEHNPREIFAKLRGTSLANETAWVLSGGFIYSFHDLSHPVWNQVCDTGAVDIIDPYEFSFSIGLDERNIFAQLLLHGLRSLVRDTLRYDSRDKLFYFSAPTPLRPRYYRYKITDHRESTRTVFEIYRSRRENSRIQYCRHLAADVSFLDIERQWYLCVVPTYKFTKDGFGDYEFAAENTSRIKTFEKHEAIRGLARFWGAVFRTPVDSFRQTRPPFTVGEPETFQIEHGIDDEAWRVERESIEIDKETTDRPKSDKQISLFQS